MVVTYGLLAALMLAAPDGDAKYCALTFDDGPRPEFLANALPLLAEQEIHATFFIVGRQIAAYPEWVKKIQAGGHELGNHSWNHPQLSRMSASGVRSELTRTADRIAQLSGIRPQYVRPPYGAQNKTVRSVIESLGWGMALWTVDPYDWQGSATANRTASRILGAVHPNAVILMHEAQPTLKALPTIIAGLRKRGYRMVTYAELMRIEAGEAPPSERVIAINCGREEGDGATLSAGCGYALEVGLRAAEPPGWVSDSQLAFRLLVPPKTTGTLLLALGGAAKAVQQVSVDGTALGEFRGAHRLSMPLSAAETADGEVLVEVVGLQGARAEVTNVNVDRSNVNG